MRPTPPGFNRREVIDGLHLAMNFGAPNDPADRVTFCWAQPDTATGADEAGVPFSPDARPVKRINRVIVPCAIEYTDATESGPRVPVDQTRVTVTLLEPDYAKVKDFEFLVWAGDKYIRRNSVVDGLGSLDVWTIYCRAEDET